MRFAGPLCLAIYALCLTAPGLASELQTDHAVTLSQPRVSTRGAGEIVIALQARGDIRGLVTLTLHADGDAIAGEWSLVSAYFQDIDENGNPIDVEVAPGDSSSSDDPAEHHDEDSPHVERITYVNRGTLGGTIDGGHVIVNADGTLTGIEGVHLTIVSSTLTFEGASGGGSLESPALGDGGSLSLTF
jgi:hypothetical protein